MLRMREAHDLALQASLVAAAQHHDGVLRAEAEQLDAARRGAVAAVEAAHADELQAERRATRSRIAAVEHEAARAREGMRAELDSHGFQARRGRGVVDTWFRGGL